MSYPTLTLSAANAMFAGIGIEISKHPLGYYEATGRGQKWQSPRLVDLTHLVLQQIAAPVISSVNSHTASTSK